VAGIERYLTNAFITNEDLRAGRWLAALRQVLDAAQPKAPIGCDGAAEAAAVLLSLLG